MKNLFLAFFCCFITVLCFAQQGHPPFWNEVQKFKTQDSVLASTAHPILLIGSSSFTMWKDVQDYFPAYPIKNRGFGGSMLTNLIFYFNDLVPPVKPKQIIIYCGENDLANDSLPADSALNRFQRLFHLIRMYDKKVPIAYISMKPSPSREKYLQKFEAANKAIQKYIRKKRNTQYINIFDAMLLPDGKPNKELFLNDQLHMNSKGYQIWQHIIEPYLKK